jgi:metallo-beta-lactamase family protein
LRLLSGAARGIPSQEPCEPAEAARANVAILTHAHIDHSGGLPTLVKAGFRGSIYATPATHDLCAAMLRDSARIQEADAAYLNAKFADDPEFVRVEPIYDEEDVVSALGHFVGVPYHHSFEPLPGVSATFLDAGHILGSAEIVLDIDVGGTPRRLVFSGDLGRKGLPIIRDPEYPERPVDYVVMESTYGDRVHAKWTKCASISLASSAKPSRAAGRSSCPRSPSAARRSCFTPSAF